MNPQCPTDYSCTLTLVHPRVITRTIGPWWHGGAGWVVAIVAIVAIACLLAYIVTLISDARNEQHQREERELERKKAIALEEQRTMQAEQAKGDPEMLKMIRSGR